MRVLVVAISDSIHTARWTRQIADQDWDLQLFPSIDLGISHPALRNLTVHHSIFGRQGQQGEGIKARGLDLRSDLLADVARRSLARLWPGKRARQLARLIDRIKPDIVHSIEFQSAAYLTLQAKDLVAKPFPKWLVTNWGSDIYLFRQLAEHRKRIDRILEECDYYSCECSRDVELARQAGLKGEVLPVWPNGGGFDLEAINRLKSSERPSARRVILLKGYQHWAGRALVGLRALERCADLLQGYNVVVYSASGDVRLAAQLFAARTGVEVLVLPPHQSHSEILRWQGKARLSIGLSMSDGISTSFLESLAMGSFPIQSDTSCAQEWAEHGKTALFVPPEDPEIVERAIRNSLQDDQLVDKAAELNWKTVVDRLDASTIAPQVVEAYRWIHAREVKRT